MLLLFQHSVLYGGVPSSCKVKNNDRSVVQPFIYMVSSFWFEVKVIVKMFPKFWVVVRGIMRCCCRRVFINNFEFNYSESVFGEISYLGNGPYGLKILK